MAWTITTWDDVDWSAAATLNEFVGAVNERKSALGQGSPFATVVAGDDVQAASFFVAYQAWIEANRGSFVVSHIVGDPWVGGHYDGEAAIATYANLAAVFSGAGLAHSNWRRYTTHPDEAGVVAYGQMQAGDIIGPWIFEDIQKCLNVLVWTKKGFAWQGGDSYQGVGSSSVSWEAAKATAEANWARTGDGVPWAVSYSRGFPSGANWAAILERYAGEAYVINVWNGVARYADWYLSTYAAGTYDAYGDDVLEDVFSLWLQDEPATDATTIVSSSKIGDASVMPNTPWADWNTVRGWDSSTPGMWVVLRWNVSGGFAYA